MTESITALTPYIDLAGRLAIATDALSRNRLLSPVIDGLKVDGEHTLETLRDDVKRVLNAVGIDPDEVSLEVEAHDTVGDDKSLNGLRFDVIIHCDYDSMYRLQFSAHKLQENARSAADLTRQVFERLATEVAKTIRVLTLG